MTRRDKGVVLYTGSDGTVRALGEPEAVAAVQAQLTECARLRSSFNAVLSILADYPDPVLRQVIAAALEPGV